MNDLQFEFEGFKPDEKIRELLSTVAEKIHLSGPSDSTTKLVVKKSKDAINISCRIASRVGTFVADAVGGDPVQALQKIERKMRQQIDQWKKRRFEDFLQRTF
jgi:ribosome-associated translation inhibitor RaiA